MSSLSYVPERGSYRLRIPAMVHYTPGGEFRTEEIKKDDENPNAARGPILSSGWLQGYIVLAAGKISLEDLAQYQVSELVSGETYSLRDVLIFLLKTELDQDAIEYDEETVQSLKDQLRNASWVVPALFECLEKNLITIEFGAPEHHHSSSKSNASASE